MVPAKALWYGCCGYHYGGLVWSRCHPHSRFREVAVLSYLCWVDADVILNTKNLSGVGDRGWELDGSPSSSSSMSADTMEKNRSQKQRLTPDGVGMRSDGQWIEQEINIELGEQCLEGKESNVSIVFRGFTRSHRCQIIIEGIGIRPRGMGKLKSWLT
ncbi:unnamed protein product [Triticum turgidum subsp. durum]|uniref:Uncharacterized protein n=1 Tax=Triticum turgidum subsp. durum TaxID=4567 RepID=A0A9R1AEQ1_TRITD|nr:unnamed protein product [Triticum turgidum subsp. durum]